MTSHPLKTIAGVALALAAGVAAADTVTFDGLHDQAGTDVGPSVTSEGFIFFSGSDLFVPAAGQSADPQGATLEVPDATAPLLVVKDDLQAFNLVSLDLAGIPCQGGGDGPGDDTSAGSGGDVSLTWLLPGTSDQFGSMTLHLDDEPGLQTFQIGLDGISFFALGDVPFQLDNVVTTSAVPEPGSLATILAGLATLAAMVRRRRT